MCGKFTTIITIVLSLLLSTVYAADIDPPTIVDNQSGDDAIYGIDPGTIFDIDFSDTGGSMLSYAQYSAWTETGMTGTETISWATIAENINSNSYTSDWGVDFSSLATGTNYISVRAADNSGNISDVATDSFYVNKINLFETKWVSSESEYSFAIACGDYDGDGYLDQLVGNANEYGYYGAPNRVYKNDGSGSFTLEWSSPESDITFAVLWGDYDGDGDLDQFVGNFWGVNRVYQNSGSGDFSLVWSSSKEELTYSESLGDYDSDGDLDLLVGNHDSVRLYRNEDGNNFNSAWYIYSDDISYISWGDYDQDNDLDILAGIEGRSNNIYKNDPGGNFVLSWSSSELEDTNAVTWGDYDGDGDLDQLIGNSEGVRARVYRNDGEETFNLYWASPETDDTLSTAWGDYDGDGDLDLLLGNGGYNIHKPNQLYRNDGVDGFPLIWESEESEMTYADIWGDFDGDGDLDQLVCNYNGVNRLYVNNLNPVNTDPTAPALTAEPDGSVYSSTAYVTLLWSPGSDAETTDSDLLTYDVCLGTSSGNCDVFGGLFPWGLGTEDSTGFGNSGASGSHSFYLSTGTYYWSVRTVDTSFNRSPWSTEDSFTLSLDTESVAPLVVDNQTGDDTIYETDPGAIYDVDFSDSGGSMLSYAQYTAWSAPGMSSGAGTELISWSTISEYINSNSYIDDWGIDFSSLASGTNYISVRAIDYAGNQSEVATDVFYVNRLMRFELIWSANNEYSKNSSWADYDGDGDLDFLSGNYRSGAWRNRLYRNDGANSFSLIWTSAESDATYEVAWGDFDGDGDLDQLVGNSCTANRLYTNDGGDSFTSTWTSEETECTCSVTWGDYDDDGDLDQLVGNGGTQANRLYRNNGNGVFISVWTSPEQEYTRSISWGDYDGDGDIDQLSGNDEVNRLYRNDGGGNFSLAWSSLEEDGTYSVAWGDVDGDGGLDHVVGNYDQGTRTYRNDGNNSFSLLWSSSDLDGANAVALGDYDCDGDIDQLLGTPSGDPIRVYDNDGSGDFSIAWDSPNEWTTNAVAWGDYDGDGDIDLLADEYPNIRLFRNNLDPVNTNPVAPSIAPEPDGSVYSNTAYATLLWSPGSDAETTDTDLLTYDVCLGKSSGNCDVFGGIFPWGLGTEVSTGLGNSGASGSHSFYLSTGTYYWSVRTVDTSFSRSLWSTEDSFTLSLDTEAIAPLVIDNQTGDDTVYETDPGAIFDVDFSDSGGSMLSYAQYTVWSAPGMSSGGGTEVISWSTIAEYINSDSYTDNWGIDFPTLASGTSYISVRAADVAGNISDVATDVFYIKKFKIFESVWTSSETDRTLSVSWSDYDSDGDLDQLVGNFGNNRIYRHDGGSDFNLFWNSLESQLTREVAWADYDNDGDLDQLTGNNDRNRLYYNVDGIFLYTAWSSSDTENTNSVTWGDYDNDGDPDQLVGNENQANRVYRNEKPFTFSLAWSSSETENTYSIDWGDYDGDGDLDQIVGNYNQENRVYRNDGSDSFSVSWVSAELGYTLSIIWGDYDGDGDLDQIVGNYNQENRVYRNDGGGNFFLAWSSTETDFTYSLALGDYDGDGDIDLLVGNYNQNNRVYQNDGGNSFSLAWTSTEADNTTALVWGDYDGDGDLDQLVGNYNQENRIYINHLNSVNTTPVPPTLTNKSNEFITNPTTTVVLNWSTGSDAETTDTDLLTYDVCLGTSSGNCDVIGGLFPWGLGTEISSGFGSAGATTTRTITFSTGTYYWSVRTVDSTFKRSAWSAEDSFTLIYDDSPPTITDNIPGIDTWQAYDPGQIFDVDFSDTGGALLSYAQYSAWNAPGASSGTGTEIISWATIVENIDSDSYTSDWGVDFTSLASATNFISVRAADNAGNISYVATDVFYIKKDTSKPADISFVNDGKGTDIDIATSSTELSANWSASSDSESGITRYWYAMGTALGSTDTVAWTDAGATTSVKITGLSLKTNQMYFISVKAENGAGLMSNSTSSDGFEILDISPPAVTDNQGGDDTWYSNDPGAIFDIDFSDTGGSMLSYVRYTAWSGPSMSYGTGTEIISWSTVAENIDSGSYQSNWGINFSMATDGYNFVSVSACDNSENCSDIATDVFFVKKDINAPTDLLVVNDGTGGDIDYSSDSTQLSANWSESQDNGSGISEYWYAIGSTAGATDVVDWVSAGATTSVIQTGLSLMASQTYFFSVKSEDNAGLFSNHAYSDGVTIIPSSDITPPSDITSVNDGPGEDIDTTISMTELSANWSESSDTESGIAKYWYGIGTTPGTTDVVDWTDNSNATSVTKTALTLTASQTYYFSVKAENGAGLFSNPTNSDGVTVLSEPTPTTITLNKGWNQVGVSLQNVSLDTDSIFTSTVYEIMAYNSGYTYLTATGTINLDLAAGYWIFSAADKGSLNTITGDEYTSGSKVISLNEGWSMFSNPYNEKIPWADSNASVSCGSLPTVYHYKDGSYTSVMPNTGNYIQPWTGYWINASGSCTLTISK